jgi:electron transport complex protein RnfD
VASPTSTYTVGTAPHWRSRSSITRLNHAFILALVPTALAGAVGHAFGDHAVRLDASVGPLNRVVKVLTVEMGLDAGALWLLGILGTLALAMGFGVLVEYLCQVAMRQPYRAMDGHGALMGMLLTLLMPPTVPWWVLLLGVAIAIVVGKQIFGGIGGYPLHPALVAWLVLLLSWPNFLYPVGAESVAAPTQAAVIATLAGGVLLWVRGHIRPQITLGVLLGVALFALLFHGRLNGGFADQFLTGHVFLGAFFLATDATCSPANRRAMWVYGFGVGFLIMLIRAFGIWHDAVPFAILLMNILSPLLDHLRPRVREAVSPR